MNLVKRSLLGLGLVLSTVSAWADVSCKVAGVVNHDKKSAAVNAKVCSISHQSPGVYGVDPLQSLQTVASVAKAESREACKAEKMHLAPFVTNFNSNSFEVSSVGVVNGGFGATATLTGRFLCVDSADHFTYTIVNAK